MNDNYTFLKYYLQFFMTFPVSYQIIMIIVPMIFETSLAIYGLLICLRDIQHHQFIIINKLNIKLVQAI